MMAGRHVPRRNAKLAPKTSRNVGRRFGSRHARRNRINRQGCGRHDKEARGSGKVRSDRSLNLLGVEKRSVKSGGFSNGLNLKLDDNASPFFKNALQDIRIPLFDERYYGTDFIDICSA